MGTLADLRTRPWPVALGLLLLGLVVLAVRAARAVALAVVVLADAVDQLEVLVCAAAGMAPVSGSVLVTPAPAPGWVPGDGR